MSLNRVAAVDVCSFVQRVARGALSLLCFLVMPLSFVVALVCYQVAGPSCGFDNVVGEVVPGSAADLAGVESFSAEGHDIIVSINGQNLAGAYKSEILQKRDATQPIVLGIKRAHRKSKEVQDLIVELPATPGERPLNDLGIKERINWQSYSPPEALSMVVDDLGSVFSSVYGIGEAQEIMLHPQVSWIHWFAALALLTLALSVSYVGLSLAVFLGCAVALRHAPGARAVEVARV